MTFGAGIDLGGTKIEAAVFDADWSVLETRRVPTPDCYTSLIDALRDQITWLQNHAPNAAIGLGAPGRHDARTGLAFMANLPADGKPLRDDLLQATQAEISFGNDCDLFALSEANLGAGKSFDTVFGLILGTGIGGGTCFNGTLYQSNNATTGEVGHLPISSGLASKYDLPILPCGCGKTGCYETLGAGPGLVRLAKKIMGKEILPQEIASSGDASAVESMQVWAEIIAELIGVLQLTFDPDCVVLGGGLSNISGVSELLSNTIANKGLRGSRPPNIQKASFGDSSGTRGAALLAVQERAAR